MKKIKNNIYLKAVVAVVITIVLLLSGTSVYADNSDQTNPDKSTGPRSFGYMMIVNTTAVIGETPTVTVPIYVNFSEVIDIANLNLYYEEVYLQWDSYNLEGCMNENPQYVNVIPDSTTPRLTICIYDLVDALGSEGNLINLVFNVLVTYPSTASIEFEFASVRSFIDHYYYYTPLDINTYDGHVEIIYPPNEPPTTPTQAEGPTEVIVGFEYFYNFSTTDPDDSEVDYWEIDCGEHGGSHYFPFPDFNITYGHTWEQVGNDSIRARAKDAITDEFSNWSEPLNITVINNPPNTPSTPIGPTEGEVGEEYRYTTNTTDPDGHQLRYKFDWDDESPLLWTAYSDSGVPINKTHIFSQAGTYMVKVKAQDFYGSESNWSEYHTVTITNTPPEPPIINGPDEGLIDIQHSFTVQSYDADEHKVRFIIDWDDGSPIEETGLVNSNEPLTINHIWDSTGPFTIKVQAEDQYNEPSSFSEHTITIKTPANITIGNITGGLFKVDVEIINTGGMEATDVNWNITIKGGFLTLINKKATGTIDVLEGFDTVITSVKPIFGLGNIEITVTVTAEGFDEVSITKPGFVFLFFIIT